MCQTLNPKPPKEKVVTPFWQTLGFDPLTTNCGFVPSAPNDYLHIYILLVWLRCLWADTVVKYFYKVYKFIEIFILKITQKINNSTPTP
jgi:hypothetical protein